MSLLIPEFLWSLHHFKSFIKGCCLAQLVEQASHVQRLCPHCRKPGFVSWRGALCCVSLPLLIFIMSFSHHQDPFMTLCNIRTWVQQIREPPDIRQNRVMMSDLSYFLFPEGDSVAVSQFRVCNLRRARPSQPAKAVPALTRTSLFLQLRSVIVTRRVKVWLSNMFELQEFLLPLCGGWGEAALVYLRLRGPWRGKPVIEPTVILSLLSLYSLRSFTYQYITLMLDI